MMKTAIGFAACTVLLAVINCSDGYARPCDPTDPLGRNKNNLCPRSPNASINDNAFMTGGGLPITTIPTTQHPAGIVLQKPSGFWTNVNTSGGKRRVKDSGGNTYILPNQNRMGGG